MTSKERLQKSDLQVGEWYYDKDFEYNFYWVTYDNTVDTDLCNVEGNEYLILERHPADQKTESKSIKCVFRASLEELSIKSVECDAEPINPRQYDTLEEELKAHPYEFLENYTDGIDEIESVSATELTFTGYDPYEIGSFTVTVQK